MAKMFGVPQKGKTRPLDFFVFKLAVSFLVCATPMKMENASFSRPRTRGRRRLTFFMRFFSSFLVLMHNVYCFWVEICRKIGTFCSTFLCFLPAGAGSGGFFNGALKLCGIFGLKISGQNL